MKWGGEAVGMKAGWRCTDSKAQTGDLGTMGKVRGNPTFSTSPVETCVCSQQIEICLW